MDSKWPARIAGGAAGLANGLFGGGGGMVFLPILSRWGTLDQRKLYATCVAVISAWGVGGGTLLLVVMTLLLGVDQRTAQGINLLFFLPTAAGALWCHWKNGCLDRPTLRAAVPAAVLLGISGAWVATAVDVELLRRPFGVYLLLSGVSLLWPRKK